MTEYLSYVEPSAEQQKAYDRLRYVYDMVYNHPFVTEDSERMRGERVLLLQSIEHQNTSNTPFINLVLGSVARGQADHRSDCDAFVLHGMDNNAFQISTRTRGVSIRQFPFTRSAIYFGKNDYWSYALFPFFPVIGEFEGEKFFKDYIRETITGERRNIIQAIAMDDGYAVISASQCWELLRERLNMLLLPNLSSRVPIQFPYDKKNRRERLEKYRSSVIAQFGSEAIRYFEELDSLSFPDWETMKIAFGVEER